MKPERDATLSAEEDINLAMRIKDARCEDAFNELYAKYKRLVHWKCYQQLSNHQDAEDATQEVFASFYERKVDAWNGRSSVAGFLCGIARNVARNIWRFEHTACRYSDNMLYLDKVDEEGRAVQIADPRSEYHISREIEVEAEIDRVLLSLPLPEVRLAWTLMHREGYTSKEVAKIMGVTWQKVTVFLNRAETFMKGAMREFYQRLVAGDAEWLENRIEFRDLFNDEE